MMVPRCRRRSGGSIRSPGPLMTLRDGLCIHPRITRPSLDETDAGSKQTHINSSCRCEGLVVSAVFWGRGTWGTFGGQGREAPMRLMPGEVGRSCFEEVCKGRRRPRREGCWGLRREAAAHPLVAVP